MAGAAFVLDAGRTPFGRYGDALGGVWRDDLLVHTLSALLTRSPGLDLGHPQGASGTRVLGSLVHRRVAAGGGEGLAAICIGVGQGLAVVAEG
jgi:acetyl-CoA acetyltransferase